MTTNYRRALATAVHCDLVDESPRELVKQLRDAGLIAPDLPEPIVEDGRPTWELGFYFDDIIILNDSVCVGIDRTYGVSISPDEAERLALALLAAIKHQKENRHES